MISVLVDSVRVPAVAPTPEEQRAARALAFRIPMPVTAVRVFSGAGAAYPVCPQCHRTFEREYQAYCDRCGQCLSWKMFRRARVIFRP